MNAQGEYSVFLVDDDKMFLTSLKNSLQQKFGSLLKVSEYSTGEECMQHIFKHHPMDDRPDIVILDYYLNDAKHPEAADGIKVLRELKSTSKDIIVIMLSGQDKLQVAMDSIKNGAFEYIAKSESAFIRTQNTLKNAIDNIKSARENSKYLRWNLYLGVFIIAIILLDVIWYSSTH